MEVAPVLSVHYAYKDVVITGRDILSKDTVKIGENTYRIYAGSPQFYKEDNKWHQIEYRTIKKEDFEKLPKKISIAPFIQEALATTAPSMDGYMIDYTGDRNWATVRDSTSASNGANTTAEDGWAAYVQGGAGTSFIMRGVFGYDLSALSGTVTAVTFNLYTTLVQDVFNDALAYMNVVEHQIATDGALVVGDFPGCFAAGDPPTKFSDDIDLTDIVAGNQWLNYTLNQDGIDYVQAQLDGSVHANFGHMEGHDINDNDLGNNANGTTIRFSEYTGTDYDPYIDVTTEAAAPPAEAPRRNII